MSNSYPYSSNPEEEPQTAPAYRIPQDQPDESSYAPPENSSSEFSDTAFGVPEKKEGKGSAIIKEIAETLVLAILIFFTVRGAVQNFKVEGSSMEPSLHNNQYLLVNKLSYVSVEPNKVFDTVLRIPVVAAARLGFGDDEAPPEPVTTAPDKRFFLFGQPNRGDIVVFRFPRQPTRDFIKRVVALPGEQVEIKAGIVYVNGQRLVEPYVLENSTYSKPAEIVPPDHYYVLGDNRNNSSDSHVWGSVPLENIVGRAWFTYWPWKQFGLIPGATFSAVAP